MRIAAAAYPIDDLGTWAAYRDKLGSWIAEAAQNGADLLVFPEYGAMELASLSQASDRGTREGSIRAVNEWIDEAYALHADLATRYGVHILSASAPVAGDARPVNQLRLFAPSGGLAIQEKQIMTRYEREVWDVRPGKPLTVIETDLGRIGILICYDAEFPLLARALVSAGAEILLAPSCTEALSGYHRVRIGAMARALENQCVAVHAPTVGEAPWCEPVDRNTGAAAIYGPPDLGFPDTGVIAQGEMNRPGWVYADIEHGAIARVRAEGRVCNHADWPRQPVAGDSIEITDIRA
ncbi:MAG: carbon-nitrogen hydrolase family protein [Rhodobacter sp.]|nr:carbon-nitrogen hydrolase family protein [Rhodobacter sp.]